VAWGARVVEGLRAAVRAFSNADLRRLEIAWSLSVTADLISTVALGVYAFERGGPTAVGIAAVVRFVPSALAAPFLALPGDRFPRERVLTVIEALRGGFVLGAGAVASTSGLAPVVYGLMALAAVASSPLRSIQFALLPALATEPEELVAANVGLASIEGLGNLIGPAAGGAMLAIWGPAEAIGVAGIGFLLASAVVLRIRVPLRFARAEGGVRPLAAAFEGIHAIATNAGPRLIVGLFLAQTVVRGTLGVFVVVAALDLLQLGTDGVGYLTAAIGIGGLVGGVITLTLVGRPQLARWFGIGLALWGAPLLVLAGAGVALPAYLALALVGIGNNLVDVAGMTLLQRTIEDRILARVLGALDGIVLAGAGVGAAVGPALIWWLGVRTAITVVGIAMLCLVLAAQRSLRRLDRVAVVPIRSLGLLRRVPMFAVLDLPTIDHLALAAAEMAVPAGTVLIRQGDAGDRFYVIDEGSFDVSADGIRVAMLGPGQYVGEIALLRNVPRTATVTALEDATVLALGRDDFLRAVTGFALSQQEAHRVAEARLDELHAGRGAGRLR
jgi:CRP-like cAMP-binding protein